MKGVNLWKVVSMTKKRCSEILFLRIEGDFFKFVLECCLKIYFPKIFAPQYLWPKFLPPNIYDKSTPVAIIAAEHALQRYITLIY